MKRHAILHSASRPQDDGGGLSDRAHPPHHTGRMSSAPTYDQWKALRLAVAALIAQALLNPVRAFVRAVKEAQAQAVALVFALARDMDEEPPAEKNWTPRTPALRLKSFPTPPDEDAWRNPPARAYGATAAKRTPPPRGPHPQRPLSVAKALVALRRILDLCADPESHAARLSRRIAAVDAPLMAAEAKAFAVQTRAQTRRNREARKAIDRSWRGRRRRESG